jgi:hypothetical protein
MTIREQLLMLDAAERKERTRALSDFMFYLGECEDNDSAAIIQQELLGQNWITLDDLDYVPAQVIDNKVKPLINKQARFMFSRKPDLNFKAYDEGSNDTVHELNQYIDDILKRGKFWSETMKAFRLATVTKRVLLRIEANPNEPIKLFWHGINDFSYQIDPNDSTNLRKVIIVKPDSDNSDDPTTEKFWYRYTYYMERSTCYLRTEKFKSSDLNNPIEDLTQNTLLTKIPCWVVINEHGIGNKFGQSDIKDIRPLQDQYNRKLSDFSDALRFNMFGQDVIIDATKESVNKVNVAPNSLLPLVSLDDKTASYSKVENTFSNAAPVEKFLTLLDDSMHDKLAIPKPQEIKQIISGKAYKYLFSELKGRCDEKWIDWEPIIRELLDMIVECCDKFKCYPDWNSIWAKIDYNILIKRNYPIPEDEEDKKRLAMEEVASNVRSRRSYIKEFGDEETYEEQFNDICKELSMITAAENEQFNTTV